MEQKTSRRQIIRRNLDYTEKEATIALAQQETKEQSKQNTIISGNKIPGGYLVTGVTVDAGSIDCVEYKPDVEFLGWDGSSMVGKKVESKQYYNIPYGTVENIKTEKQDKESEKKYQILTGTQQEMFSYEEHRKAQKAIYEELEKAIELKKSSNASLFDEISLPSATDRYKKNIIKKNEKIVLNKDEELIINIEELADELANEALKIETNTLEYKDLLNKYKELILKHERAKKQ